MPKYKNWDYFKIHCGSIHKLLTNPPHATDVTKKDAERLAKINLKEEKTDKEIKFIEACKAKKDRFLNPPLSDGCKNHLIERYFKDKYNANWVSAGSKFPAEMLKGASLEPVAIEILSRVDGIDYFHPEEAKSNDFLIGRPDIYCYDNKKLLDIKITWNAASFGKLHLQDLAEPAYAQINGYMDIYGFEEAEVCYLLLNTPSYMIEQKRKDFFRKFVDGSITRDVFDEKLEELADQFDYEKKIPEAKRIIRHPVKKDNAYLERVYKKMPLCREFLAEYDRIFMKNNKIVALPENYQKNSKVSEEGNAEHNTPEPYQE